MRDISTSQESAAFNLIKLVGLTNDHGWELEPVLDTSNLACGTTELSVNLHGNVRAILGLSLHDMSNGET
jgi:hypothetical protein